MIQSTNRYGDAMQHAHSGLLHGGVRAGGDRHIFPRISSNNYLHPYTTLQDLFFWVKDTSSTSDVKATVQKGLIMMPEIFLPESNDALSAVIPGKKFDVVLTEKTGIVDAQTLSLKIVWETEPLPSQRGKVYRVGDFGAGVGGELMVRALVIESTDYVLHNTDTVQTDTRLNTFIPISDFLVRTDANGDKFLRIKQRHVGVLCVYPLIFASADGDNL